MPKDSFKSALGGLGKKVGTGPGADQGSEDQRQCRDEVDAPGAPVNDQSRARDQDHRRQAGRVRLPLSQAAQEDQQGNHCGAAADPEQAGQKPTDHTDQDDQLPVQRRTELGGAEDARVVLDMGNIKSARDAGE